MGADESKLNAAQLRSQRDEDIPYTSYSISKPIDGDSSRLSGVRSRTRNRSPQPSSRESTARDGAAAQSKHDIVVVAEGTAQDDTDTELQKLDSIPVFLPLMRASLNIPNVTQTEEVLDKLDCRELLQLCHRYQEHLRQCSEAVAFDQNALCVRIKEIDITIQTLYTHLTERQRKYAKYAEQIQKVNEMSTVLSKVKMNIEQVLPLMDKLNSVLPEEEQLEPFVFKVNK